MKAAWRALTPTPATALALAGVLGASIWMRVAFYRAFPDPFVSPDTWSYLTGTYGLLDHGRFDLYSVRTPAVPLFFWAILAPTSSMAAVTIGLGALTLASCVFLAYVVRAFGGPWQVPVVLGVALLAVNTQLLFWEHFLLSEGPFSAAVVFALGGMALALRDPAPRTAAIAGLLCALCVMVRPQGQFLPPLLALALLVAVRKLERRRIAAIVGASLLAPALLFGIWSTRNAFVHGFFGLTDFGPHQIFGTAARWIELDTPELAEVKQIIRPHIERYRRMPDEINWVQSAPNGPLVAIAAHYGDDRNARNRALAALSREAILAHPGAWIDRGLATTRKLLATEGGREACGYQCMQRFKVDWKGLRAAFPHIDEHRAEVGATNVAARSAVFERDVLPLWSFDRFFIRASYGATAFALLSLPLPRGPRRRVVALCVLTNVLLVLLVGFLSEPKERYLSIVHAPAAIAFALALAGVFEFVQRVGAGLFNSSARATATPSTISEDGAPR